MDSTVQQLIAVQAQDSDNGWNVEVRPENWFKKNYPKPDEVDSGKPFFAWYREQKLTMVPIPDGVYTILYSYHKTHPELTSDTDSTLSKLIDRSVIAYGCYHLFLYKENGSLAGLWKNEYERRIEKAYLADRRQPAIENPRVDDPGLVHNDRRNDPFTAVDGYDYY